MWPFKPKPTAQDQCHKKRFYDLESVQARLGITQEEVDMAWSKRKVGKPVFLRTVDGTKHFISNYE